MWKLTLGHSPDADDAFMFFAMKNGRIDTSPVHYEHVLHDIQTLNEMLLEGKLDISAASVHACVYLSRRYEIMASGASMGVGYGPIVVSKHPASLDDLKGAVVAVPGTLTTAFLALKLCIGLFPFVVMPFDRILDAVIKGEVPFGLLIHEGQLTYADAKLVKVLDLGEWWHRKTQLPLPLGVNVIRKDLPNELKQLAVRHLRESIAYALSNKEEAISYALKFARGLDPQRTSQFVGMYVNELTVDMGERGKEAIIALLELAARKGFVPHIKPNFVDA